MAEPRSLSGDRRAAIVCSHVAVFNLPILRAVRDEPTMPEDSGWQFLCASGDDEDPDAAKVWLISEVVVFEPSLIPYIGLPPGTVLTRDSLESAWEIGRK